MHADARKLLCDAQQAAERITRFSSGKSFSDYERDEYLRSAVKRQFEIIDLEVLRNAAGAPAKMLWTPAWSVRAKPLGSELIAVQERVRISDLRWMTDVNYRRFRSYVQVDLQGTIVARYKEYGDPRVMSRRTGRYYTSLAEMQSAPEEVYNLNDGSTIPVQPATELLSFQLPSSVSCSYGKPAWTGIYPALEGTRDLEEENQTLIVDRKVPQMFILRRVGAAILIVVE